MNLENESALVSIVTLTKNNESDLKKTINSVINQSYANIEYIISNGGEDLSVEIINLLESSKVKKISILEKQNKGIYPSMNYSLKFCSGKWINFMNAGDAFLNKDAIERAVEGQSDTPSILLMRHEDNIFLQKFIKFKIYRNLCQQTIFYNSKKLGEIIYFDETFKYSADLELLFRIHFFDKKYFVKNIRESIIFYQPGGMSGQNTISLINEKKNILTKHKRELNFLVWAVNMLFVNYVKLKLKFLGKI